MFPRLLYEDFKLHMAQVYQQYERQYMADDPAQVANHPISTISYQGLKTIRQRFNRKFKRSTVKITEIVDKEEGKL